MFVKMTADHQLTLPKNITAALGSPEYFDVAVRNGQLILTPVRMPRSDTPPERLAALEMQERNHTATAAQARQSDQ